MLPVVCGQISWVPDTDGVAGQGAVLPVSPRLLSGPPGWGSPEASAGLGQVFLSLSPALLAWPLPPLSPSLEKEFHVEWMWS